jgi:DNA-binding NtrC family response regulator
LQAHDGTVPVIFITASTESEQVIEATKLGSYDYVVKPIDLHRVRDLVERGLIEEGQEQMERSSGGMAEPVRPLRGGVHGAFDGRRNLDCHRKSLNCAYLLNYR